MNDALTGQTVELLQQLIRNRCVNDGSVGSGQEVRTSDVLRGYLDGSGLDVEVYEPDGAPGRTSLVARIEGTDPAAPTLCLMGHTDVVPVTPEHWTRDPFGGELVAGEVWGRGAVDMLNLTASQAVALRALARQPGGWRPRGTLVYLACADEEAGGGLGAGHVCERHWDALWSVAQEAGLPVHFHIGSGDTASSFTPVRIAAHGSAATYAYTSVEMFLKNGLQVADLLTSGVLPRFPELRFVSVESGIGWIPFVLEAVDHSYLEARPHRVSEWDLLPSEYFRRQVYACYWFETVAPAKLLDDISVDNVLFETDFPHPTCLYGDVRARIDASLAHASEAARRKILWENAARLYRVEPARP